MSNIDQARIYLETAPHALSGKGGHNTTFKIACELIQGFSLTEVEALAVLAEYNARLADRWSPQELQHKINDASLKKSRFPEGYMLNDFETRKRRLNPLPASRTIWKIVRKTPKPLVPKPTSIQPSEAAIG